MAHPSYIKFAAGRTPDEKRDTGPCQKKRSAGALLLLLLLPYLHSDGANRAGSVPIV